MKGLYRKKSKIYKINIFILLKIQNFLSYKNTVNELGTFLGTFLYKNGEELLKIYKNEDYICSKNIFFSNIQNTNYNDFLNYLLQIYKIIENPEFCEFLNLIKKYLQKSVTNFDFSLIENNINFLENPCICIQFYYFLQDLNKNN